MAEDEPPKIAAAAPPVEYKQLTVAIESSGRPFIVAVPVDITDEEVLEAGAWFISPSGMRAELKPASPIFVPGKPSLRLT